MPEVDWRQAARDDLRSIFGGIADDNPTAALALLDEIETKVGHPSARPNDLVVYAEVGGALVILRILHAAQMWP